MRFAGCCVVFAIPTALLAASGCTGGDDPSLTAASAYAPDDAGDDSAPDADAADDVADTAADTLADTEPTDASVADTYVAPDSAAEDTGADVAADSEAAAVSTYCGDGIRDLLTEECDDGVTTDAGRRTCGTDCRTLDVLALAPPTSDAGLVAPGRTLGSGRHPIAAGSSGFAVAFVEPESSPVTVGLTTYDVHGVASDVVVPFGGGTGAVIDANPVLAALPSGKFAAAWTDFGGDGDGLGIALRIVDPSSPSSAPPSHANTTTAFSQHDADVLWTLRDPLVSRTA